MSADCRMCEACCPLESEGDAGGEDMAVRLEGSPFCDALCGGDPASQVCLCEPGVAVCDVESPVVRQVSDSDPDQELVGVWHFGGCASAVRRAVVVVEPRHERPSVRELVFGSGVVCPDVMPLPGVMIELILN